MATGTVKADAVLTNMESAQARRVAPFPVRGGESVDCSVAAVGTGGSRGGIAQLAEHELCKLGVTGSNPVASTNRAMRDYRAVAQAKAGWRPRACSSVG